MVSPSIRFQNSFLEAAEEYRREYRETENERIKRYADLDLEKLIAQAKGEGLPEGFVRDSAHLPLDAVVQEMIYYVLR